MKKLLHLYFVFCLANCFAQEPISVELDLLFGAEQFQLEKWYKLGEQDSVYFESLRFYLSNFELTAKGKNSWKENESYHLIDAENPASWKIQLNPAKNSTFDSISFHLGIDSLTNAGGVRGGDLDPVKGMYWTWQTGYIHFKAEGKSNLCPTRKQQFSLHIGGFSFPDNTCQEIVLPLNGTKARVAFDLQAFMKKIDLRTQNNVMSPGPQAVELSQKLAALFQSR